MVYPLSLKTHRPSPSRGQRRPRRARARHAHRRRQTRVVREGTEHLAGDTGDTGAIESRPSNVFAANIVARYLNRHGRR